MTVAVMVITRCVTLKSVTCRVGKHCGITEEELDFIINYDIKYRMGDELHAGE